MLSWAYRFDCEKSLYEMETILKEAGSWAWRVRDCAWYPDFLQCSSEEGVRICLYQETPPNGRVYFCLVEILKSDLKRPSIDPPLLESLKKLPLQNLSEIPPPEWPFD